MGRKLGEFDFNEANDPIPFAIQRLHTTSERSIYDTSSMSPGIVCEIDESNDEVQLVNTSNNTGISYDTVNYVHQLPMDLFRSCLVENLDILFKQNKVR